LSQVTLLLDALWASDRVSKSTILSPEEKQLIRTELVNTLPPEMLCAGSVQTRTIVLKHMSETPSITPDEEPIVRPTAVRKTKT
jgi:hypothetical protein